MVSLFIEDKVSVCSGGYNKITGGILGVPEEECSRFSHPTIFAKVNGAGVVGCQSLYVNIGFLMSHNLTPDKIGPSPIERNLCDRRIKPDRCGVMRISTILHLLML